MTTVACDGKSVAADQRVSWDDNAGFRSPKVFRIGGSIFGLRGDNYANVFLEWAKSGFRSELKPVFPDPVAEVDFTVIELAEDGMHMWDHMLVRVPILDKNYAIGSGHKVALYAMRVLKLAPGAAVHEASKIDPFTDDNVDEIFLTEKAKV